MPDDSSSSRVHVETTPSGLPVSVRIGPRTWRVGAEPVRWYEKRTWWEAERRAQKGAGPGLIDLEVWQLQVRLGARGQLRTIEIEHDHQTGAWVLRQDQAE